MTRLICNITISVVGLLGLTRNIAEEDVKDFTYRNEIPAVSPFLPARDTPPNIRTTTTNEMEQEQVITFLPIG